MFELFDYIINNCYSFDISNYISSIMLLHKLGYYQGTNFLSNSFAKDIIHDGIIREMLQQGLVPSPPKSLNPIFVENPFYEVPMPPAKPLNPIFEAQLKAAEAAELAASILDITDPLQNEIFDQPN